MKRTDWKTIFLICGVAGLTACSDASVNWTSSSTSSSSSSGSSSSSCYSTTSVTVEAAFSVADDWNEWMENVETSFLDISSEVACDGDHLIDGGSRTGEQAGFRTCIHGGELRKVQVSGETSCSGLEISDRLNMFNWVCTDSGAYVVFYSTGLKAEKGLRDLLDASDWKTNSVSITNSAGCTVYESSATAWWNNTVVNLDSLSSYDMSTPGSTGVTGVSATNTGGSADADVFSLETSGIVYTVSTTDEYYGFNIGAASVSFAVLPGVTVKAKTSDDNCDATTNVGATGSTSKCLIASNSKNYPWIEGNFDLQGSYDYGIVLGDLNFATLRNLSVGESANKAILFGSVDSSRLDFFRLMTNAVQGIYLRDGSDHNRLTNFSIFNTGSYGVHIQNSDANTLVHGIISNSGGHGIRFYLADQNTVTHVVSSNNTNAGLYMDSSVGNPSASNTFVNLSLLNNSAYGFNGSKAEDTIFSQFIAYGNGTSGVVTGTGVDQTVFNENVMVSTCGISGTNSTMTTATCAPDASNGGSYNLVNSFDPSSSFVGRVTSGSNEDISNMSGGVATTISDHLHFDNFFRGWGVGTSAILANANRGDCSANCSIWDYRLISTDGVMRNTTHAVTTHNDDFQADTSCPDAVDGDVTLVDLRGTETNGDSIGNDNGDCEHLEACGGDTQSTFLTNATEIIGDGSGDEDGLCESNESCLYSPNFGAYQGSGDYLSNGSCVFNDGTGSNAVTGVTMYAYPSNGV